MAQIIISINDTRTVNSQLDHNPRLYNLSKKLSFFVRYLNANYFEGQFVNGGASTISTSGQGCFFLIDGIPLNSGNSFGDDVGVSNADREFLLNESFNDFEFTNYSRIFTSQLEKLGIRLIRRN